ncbi:MAG: hypothetical protein NTZ69_16640 [Bacteroidia bacterium]|nr:hypothetical protein [Bacteroidia bacterium]
MANNGQLVYANFEMLDSNEDNAVFKRIVKAKGRTNKEIQKIEQSLPTVTVHYFSELEFNRLKEIESQLVEEFKNSNTNKSTVKNLGHYMRHFFEI